MAIAAAMLLGASAAWASTTGPAHQSHPDRLRGWRRWEPSIAADSSGNVYALWTHYVGFEGSDTGEVDPTCPECPSPHMVIQISNDNGATWGEPHALAPSEERQDDPQIVVDPVTQAVYAAYMEGDKSSMFVARSDDFGQTFEPVLVEEIERGLDKIALAARDDHVYLVYHSQQKIFASSSHDGGATWAVTQPVHNTNSKLGVSLPSGGHRLEAGNAYFAWNGANRPGQAKGTVNLFVTKTGRRRDDMDDLGRRPVRGVTAVRMRRLGVLGFADGDRRRRRGSRLRPVECQRGERSAHGCISPFDRWRRQRGAIQWTSRAPRAGRTTSSRRSSLRITATFGLPGRTIGTASTPVARIRPRGGTRTTAARPMAGRPGPDEWQLSAFVSRLSAYKFATPADGYLQPYGDYFELDINSPARPSHCGAKATGYIGPGNVWFARQP